MSVIDLGSHDISFKQSRTRAYHPCSCIHKIVRQRIARIFERLLRIQEMECSIIKLSCLEVLFKLQSVNRGATYC